jgi:hypothetical protein
MAGRRTSAAKAGLSFWSLIGTTEGRALPGQGQNPWGLAMIFHAFFFFSEPTNAIPCGDSEFAVPLALLAVFDGAAIISLRG